MPAFTLGRLAKLYGMHRSTVYEAVEKGRVSAGLDGKGQKVIDLSEAIRVWGEPPTDPTAKPDTRQPAPVADPTHPTDALQPLLEELRLLREELAGLRAELRLIEHKPATPPVMEKGGEQPPSGPVGSFADLLKTLDG
ncbi:hypothetical protein [Stutzerimonas stutzeri]|nr:hypothetical protein [Stutzerimonas stutzeri]